jgi:sec-independent protein translocase protein TatB
VEFLGIGLPELLVILVLILLVVGPNRLPEMAAQLARFLRAARRYSNQVTKDFNETVAELEQEYDEMKGDWKEVGQGLDESMKEVSKDLQAADKDVREALNEASAAADDPSTPTTPTK